MVSIQNACQLFTLDTSIQVTLMSYLRQCRDLKMVQQETRKLDGQCVDFCDILKDRCFFFFFSQTDCMPKTVRWNVQKNYRRTATRAVSTDFLSLLHCPFVFNDCIMLRTIRARIFNKNPKISDTQKYCYNHLIN